MTDWLTYRHQSCCEGKPAIPRASVADRLAAEASQRTGELIISYQCFDCGWWHIGHADESQIAARVPPPKRTCLACGKQIPPSRIEQAQRSGFKTRACSKACAKRLRELRSRERRRLADTQIATVEQAPDAAPTHPEPPCPKG